MTERQNQVMQFLYEHATNIDVKSTELHEIAIMMRNCLNELEMGEENTYTKTCRMEKEFAEEEMEGTKKKLDIAVGALKEITNNDYDADWQNDLAQATLEKIKDIK